jgi:hypothetical protein
MPLPRVLEMIAEVRQAFFGPKYTLEDGRNRAQLCNLPMEITEELADAVNMRNWLWKNIKVSQDVEMTGWRRSELDRRLHVWDAAMAQLWIATQDIVSVLPDDMLVDQVPVERLVTLDRTFSTILSSRKSQEE